MNKQTILRAFKGILACGMGFLLLTGPLPSVITGSILVIVGANLLAHPAPAR